MNVTLADAIETSPDGESFTKMNEILVRGKDIKYLRLPQELIPQVKAMNMKNQQQGRNRNINSNNDRRNFNPNRQGGNRNYNRQGGNSNQNRGGNRRYNSNNNQNARPQQA
jgi:U6 snRNA-associated Sm-like protein LSm4